jgi:hypothetical protein
MRNNVQAERIIWAHGFRNSWFTLALGLVVRQNMMVKVWQMNCSVRMVAGREGKREREKERERANRVSKFPSKGTPPVT